MATPQAQGIFEMRVGQPAFMARETLIANGKKDSLQLICNGAEYFCCAVLANNSGATLYLLVFIDEDAILGNVDDPVNFPGVVDAPLAFVKVDTATTGFIEFAQGLPVTGFLHVVASTTPTSFTPPAALLDAVLTATYA